MENNLAAEQSKAKSKEKHLAAEKKRNETLNTALRKFAYAPNTLTVPDIKALVAASQEKNDSPVKQRREDLMKQLYSEPWYSRVQMIAANVRPTTLTPDDDPADVTIDEPAAVMIDDRTAVAAAAEALVLVAYQAV